MAKTIASEKKAPKVCGLVKSLGFQDPCEAGFKQVDGPSESLCYAFIAPGFRLNVKCDFKEKDGMRWLVLGIDRSPGLPGHQDISFVRKAFLGRDMPALLFYAPDDPTLPLSDNRINLWTPLDRIVLPNGLWEGRGA